MALQIVNDIAALRGISGAAANDVAETLGYYAVNDGGGGQFYWEPSIVTGENGGTIIVKTTSPVGRWLRIVSDKIDVKWFGAKGDGVTDDTTAIQNAIAAVPLRILGDLGTGGQVYFSKTIQGKYYRITSKILIEHTCLQIVGENKGVIIRNESTQPAFEIKGVEMVGNLSGNYMTFKDIAIYGNGDATGTVTNAHGIHFITAPNFVLDNVIIKFHKGHGIYYTNGAWVGSFVSTEISFSNGDGVHAVSPGGGQYEQNGNAFSFVNTLVGYNQGSGINWKAAALNVSGCTIEQNKQQGILVDTRDQLFGAYGINITGNYFEKNFHGEMKFISFVNNTTEPPTVNIIQGVEISGNQIYSTATAADAPALIVFSGPPETMSCVHLGKNNYAFSANPLNVQIVLIGNNTFRRDCFIDDSFKYDDDYPFKLLGNARTLNTTTDTDTPQTITGVKTFDADIILNNGKGLRWWLNPPVTIPPTLPSLKYVLRLTSANIAELAGGIGGIALKSSGNIPLLTVSDSGIVNVPFLSASLPVFTDASKNLTNTGSTKDKSVIKTVSYTVVASDFGTNGTAVIYADATSGSIDITLPLSTALTGLSVMVVKIDSTANTVTVKRSGSDVINGATTDVLSSQYSSGVYKASPTAGYIYKVLGQ